MPPATMVVPLSLPEWPGPDPTYSVLLRVPLTVLLLDSCPHGRALLRHCERSEAIQSRPAGTVRKAPDCFVALLLAMTSPKPSLRAKRSNPVQRRRLDCFVALLLAMTTKPALRTNLARSGSSLRSNSASSSLSRL